MKQHQIAEKLPHRIGVRHIKPGVKDDQQTDAQDKYCKQQSQPIQHEICVQPKAGQPVDLGLNQIALQNCGGKGRDHRKGKGSDHKGTCRTGITPETDRQPRQQRPQKGQGGNQRK